MISVSDLASFYAKNSGRVSVDPPVLPNGGHLAVFSFLSSALLWEVFNGRKLDGILVEDESVFPSKTIRERAIVGMIRWELMWWDQG